jgi:hypothetical protein
MRGLVVVAVLTLALPLPAQAAGARETLHVSLHGTVIFDSVFESDDAFEGGACTAHSTWKGHDILEYRTTHDVRVTISGGGATVRVPVRWTDRVSGTHEVTNIMGNCPNGIPPFVPTGCGTYTGTMTLRLQITATTVRVSGNGSGHFPGLCPGTRSLHVPKTTGRIGAFTRATVVTGKGAESNDQYEFTSRFQARLARG